MLFICDWYALIGAGSIGVLAGVGCTSICGLGEVIIVAGLIPESSFRALYEAVRVPIDGGGGSGGIEIDVDASCVVTPAAFTTEGETLLLPLLGPPGVNVENVVVVAPGLKARAAGGGGGGKGNADVPRIGS